MLHPLTPEQALAQHPAEVASLLRRARRSCRQLAVPQLTWAYYYGVQLAAFSFQPPQLAFVQLVATHLNKQFRCALTAQPATLPL